MKSRILKDILDNLRKIYGNDYIKFCIKYGEFEWHYTRLCPNTLGADKSLHRYIKHIQASIGNNRKLLQNRQDYTSKTLEYIHLQQIQLKSLFKGLLGGNFRSFEETESPTRFLVNNFYFSKTKDIYDLLLILRQKYVSRYCPLQILEVIPTSHKEFTIYKCRGIDFIQQKEMIVFVAVSKTFQEHSISKNLNTAQRAVHSYYTRAFVKRI